MATRWGVPARAFVAAMVVMLTLGAGIASAETVVGGAQDPANISGFWEAGSDGSVQAFGGAGGYGSEANTQLNAPVVGMAATPGGGGYWLVGADGGVFTNGNAHLYGGMAGQHLNKPIVGMAATPDGGGYWLVGGDGGIFNFGDAHFYGSAGSTQLAAPIVGMAATPDGAGYWLVGADGGIFAYGDARFYGSLAGKQLNKPIVGMAATPDGGGYWLVGADGGIFNFGDAHFYGSLGNTSIPAPIVGIAATPAGTGYRLFGQSGDVYAFGTTSPAPAGGSTAPSTPVSTTPVAGSSPQPHARRHAIRVRLTFAFSWNYALTDVTSVTVTRGRLPSHGTLALRCRGRGCPRRGESAIGRRRARALLRRIAGRRYQAGQRLILTLSARGERSERIEVVFRDGRVPKLDLLRG